MKTTRIFIVLALALGAILAMAWLLAGAHLPTAQAAPLAPAASVIYVDADAVGANDGTSWTDAFTDLQDGLNAAGPGDEIWVAEGVYTPTNAADRSATFQLKDGVALYGGFVATETVRTQRDWETHVTVLSGDLDGNDVTDANGVVTDTADIVGDNAYHVVTGSGVTETARLDGFTITAGKADGGYPDGLGGGMHNDGSSPQLANVTFSGNDASFGGGMSNRSSSSPTLVNVAFSGNTANEGGGMFNLYSSSPTLVNVAFSANSGGGMYNDGGSPTLTDVTFSGNSGGGMHNDGSNPTLTDVTFSGNDASFGGGMRNHDGSSPTLTDVTFSGNTANVSGGGMYNSSSPTLVSVTFSGNDADFGGGMYNDGGSPTLTNCILWGNTATYGGSQIENDTSTPVVSYSLVQDSGGSGAGWDTTLGTDGGGNIDVDPLFARDPDPGDGDWTTLADNDYGDLRLQPSSPAVDAGDNTAVPADTSDLDGDGNTTEPVPLDLAGRPRFLDTPGKADTGSGTPPIVDMGAYEANVLYVDADVHERAGWSGRCWPG
jgi:predicted outer membrane repeat protein